jgi:propanol-preferring alcohol dehydrogenase
MKMAEKIGPTGVRIPEKMRAMRIHHLGLIDESSSPLQSDIISTPCPQNSEVLIQVHACGVCHTELDEIEGRTAPAALPMIPGHQVVGPVIEEGPDCRLGTQGRRVGVAWIYSACGTCKWCTSGRENLCPDFIACGRDAAGGYAQFMVAREGFIHEVPAGIGDCEATPLLCAGAVGYRALSMCELSNGQALGLTGFGASGHLVLQMSKFLYPDTRVYVFARSRKEREFATDLGAFWSGDTRDRPPQLLDSIIDTTPAWLPVLSAMENLAPGGRLVINAIRKEVNDREELLQLDYERHLWQEKSIRSVANVTRKDVRECLSLAAQIPLQPFVTEYSLDEANAALIELKQGHIMGAKVIRMAQFP